MIYHIVCRSHFKISPEFSRELIILGELNYGCIHALPNMSFPELGPLKIVAVLEGNENLHDISRELLLALQNFHSTLFISVFFFLIIEILECELRFLECQ